MDSTKYRIIKVGIPSDYYNKKAVEYYYIQKKGWFGWKTLEDVYDGNWNSHHAWSYFKSRHFFHSDINDDTAFETRKDAELFLETFLGKRKARVLEDNMGRRSG